MHTPVLLQQAIDSLEVKTGGKYIDATFGEGGYSQEIVRRGGKVLAIDLDINQLNGHSETAHSQLARSLSRMTLKLVQGNFADIERIAKENDYDFVDGIIFDLGLSMGQLGSLGRGFSYKNLNDPLDMRINVSSGVETAADLIWRLKESELYELFAKNSEELRSKEIAHEVKIGKKINSVSNLITAINRAIPYKSYNTYAKIFQALRIEVNDEFLNLRRGLEGAAKITNKSGKIVVVTFHSLEDRIVKNFVKNNNCKLSEKKPIRSKSGYKFERSAKIRAFSI
ncbi:MAG: Ribosomal RNA small subunit methyltransferase H [Candidatus Roizmanbacteria bacterium GW2011_GWA2_35_8]|uniref:Ribosomal RNA small subunit methyltransferase H n=1 Tax=Candidatus Roizmanbacteria bacterium GW2011_GWA2_35_8 TaxID=1618479 RepID=A0A0G0DF81_9BACT|nr:MAG: Ribosomal RNA small subunit methyltransferase H [Candidatus Roizmanbacteria bacterium GW2011_GWA2_35_8]